MLGIKFGRKTKETGLSFCETVFATGTSPHHIRQLTAEGMKTGGGADTLALCGTKVAWDTSKVESLDQLQNRRSHEHASNRICTNCFEAASSVLS